jgi:hypothetical protein
LQASSNPIPDSEYISRDDETEAERLEKLDTNPNHIRVLTDEEIKQYSMTDFGFSAGLQ